MFLFSSASFTDIVPFHSCRKLLLLSLWRGREKLWKNRRTPRMSFKQVTEVQSDLFVFVFFDVLFMFMVYLLLMIFLHVLFLFLFVDLIKCSQTRLPEWFLHKTAFTHLSIRVATYFLIFFCVNTRTQNFFENKSSRLNIFTIWRSFVWHLWQLQKIGIL